MTKQMTETETPATLTLYLLALLTPLNFALALLPDAGGLAVSGINAVLALAAAGLLMALAQYALARAYAIADAAFCSPSTM